MSTSAYVSSGRSLSLGVLLLTYLGCHLAATHGVVPRQVARLRGHFAGVVANQFLIDKPIELFATDAGPDSKPVPVEVVDARHEVVGMGTVTCSVSDMGTPWSGEREGRFRIEVERLDGTGWSNEGPCVVGVTDSKIDWVELGTWGPVERGAAARAKLLRSKVGTIVEVAYGAGVTPNGALLAKLTSAAAGESSMAEWPDPTGDVAGLFRNTVRALRANQVSVPGIGLPVDVQWGLWLIVFLVLTGIVAVRSRIRAILPGSAGGLDQPWLVLDGTGGLERLFAYAWLFGMLVSPALMAGALVMVHEGELQLAGSIGNTWYPEEFRLFDFVPALLAAAGTWLSFTTVVYALRVRHTIPREPPAGAPEEAA